MNNKLLVVAALLITSVMFLSGCYYSYSPLSTASVKEEKLLGTWKNIKPDLGTSKELTFEIDSGDNRKNIYKITRVYSSVESSNKTTPAKLDKVTYKMLLTKTKVLQAMSVEVEAGKYQFYPYKLNKNKLTLYQINDGALSPLVSNGKLKGHIEQSSDSTSGGTIYLQDTPEVISSYIEKLKYPENMSIYLELEKSN
jgi:hypothetical protein